MHKLSLVLLVALLSSGCLQKPVPWVKTNAQKAYNMLGFEKDRGSSITVPAYYRDSNHEMSEQAAEIRYLPDIYPDKDK